MAKSSRPSKAGKQSRSAKHSRNESTVRNSRTTVSGPAEPDAAGIGDVAADKAAAAQDFASAFAFNTNKAAEYDPDAALAPPEGASVKPPEPIAGASTVSELNASEKIGSGGPNTGQNPTVGPLDRVRVDSTDRRLTTNAEPVAAGLGIRELPEPMPKVMTQDVTPEVSVSPALSLFARAGDGSIRTRRVAILVADGCEAETLMTIADRLTDEGAVPRFVSTTLDSVQSRTGDEIEVDVNLEAALAVLYDALVLPNTTEAIDAFRAGGRTAEFVKDQYRHCKPILALGASDPLLTACRIDRMLPNGQPDPGLLPSPDPKSAADDFVAAIARHRHFERETAPPRV
jgi:hypothetical protein